MRKHLVTSDPLPEWCKVGTLVDYYSTTFAEEAAIVATEIFSPAWKLGGTWVVKINDMSGGVSVGCLEPTSSIQAQTKGAK